MSAKPLIHTLVLGGGGAKGIAMLGALHYFVSIKRLILPGKPGSKLERISGTSIGSIIGAMIAAGFTPQEIYKLSRHLKPFGTPPISLWSSIHTHFGAYKISESIGPLIDAITNKMGKNMTFKEFMAATGVNLKVCAADITGLAAIYFSAETDPDLLVSEALAGSCCLPLIYQKMVINGRVCVDGGFVDNVPRGAWNVKGVPLEGDGVLVISVSGFSKEEKIDSVISYMIRISATTMLARAAQDAERYHDLSINITLENMPFLPSSLTRQDRKDMYMKGYATAKSVDCTMTFEVPGELA